MATPDAARRSALRAWALYSWADHAFATTVAAVLIGPFLLALTRNAVGPGGDVLRVGPLHLAGAAWPSAVVTAATILQLPVLPLLGAAADSLGVRRRLLGLGCATGAVLVGLLALPGDRGWLLAGLLFLAASVVFGAADVVYNSYLPGLVPAAGRDRASSTGFAYGYLGGGLLLALNLALVQLHGQLGLSRGTAVRLAFVTAALWWAGFGAVAIRRLPPDPPAARRTPGTGRAELTAALGTLRRMPQVRRYLLAYLLFSDAISAVIALAATYVTHELYGDDVDRAAPFLFALILVIQVVAVAGSVLGGRLAGRVGAKRTVLATLVVWSGVVGFAYAVLRTPSQAVAMGVVIGLVLGASQALSRSMWAQMIPAGREATFFGLYEVCNRGTSWLAPLAFTVVVTTTGSFRQAILSLVVFFVLGGVLLARTDVEAAAEEAQDQPPAAALPAATTLA